MLAGFLYEVVTGQYQFQSIIYTLTILVPAVAALFLGITRIRNPEQEKWPEEYGLWTYLAVLFLAGMTGWFLYLALLSE